MRPLKKLPYMRRAAALLTLLLTVVLTSGCSGQFVVLDPKGPIGDAQRDLIVFATLLCAVVIVPVLILTAIIVWRYRDKPGSKASYKPEWEHSAKLETIWWGIPVVIIIILAAVTVKYTYALEPSKPIVSEKDPITIQVTSLDWKWLFMYPEQGIATVNYLSIPEDVPVRFELTSDAPMNSFWIPQLGGQIYTMSGMAMTLYLQADEAGDYFGSGANFSGEHYAKMRFDVKAMPQEQFDAWVREVKATSSELTKDGYEALAEPGVSEQQSFSAFPEQLFREIVTKYAPSGSHHHGGAHVEPQPQTQEEQHSHHSAH
ncbi:ubiquinol oxidase subunit II [Paenibacillus alkalitolerans]|uniref:ubiquinol oxidase subunit II n=1 Tax=Paenibacillus alkalitolerans TaxID=2799335 RepID=UPI0018F6AA88|nr:ubiquinol oxidase subunit II [Paenibacillus alkalitolerans]